MGFNLGTFLGGAASGGSQVLDERRAQADRDKVTKEERQWQIATEARAAARARKATRASKKNDTEEMAGLLKSLGFNDANITTALSQGKSAVALYAEAAKNNFGKEGFNDPNALFEVAGANATPQEVLSTLPENGVTPIPAEAPSLTATSELSASTVPNNRQVYLGAAFGSPPPKLNSLNALHTNILQDMMATKNPNKLAALQIKEQNVLKAIKKAAEASDTSDPSSDERTITVPNYLDMVKVRNRQALNKAKIQTDLDGVITQSIDGLEGIVAIAQAEGAQEMLNINATLPTSDPLITEPTKQYISVQKEDLSQFARKVSRVATVPKEGDTEVVLADLENNEEKYYNSYKGILSTGDDMLNAVRTGEVVKGSVVMHKGRLFVFVGTTSPLATKGEDGTINPYYEVGTGY